jgi:hypothetical protein
LDGYEEGEGETTNQTASTTSHTSQSYADSHSVFDFMNEDFPDPNAPPVPPPVVAPSTTTTTAPARRPLPLIPPQKQVRTHTDKPYTSKAASFHGTPTSKSSVFNRKNPFFRTFSDENWNEDDINRFTESIVVGENEAVINFNNDEDGEINSDEELDEDDDGDDVNNNNSFESKLSRLSLSARKLNLAMAIEKEKMMKESKLTMSRVKDNNREYDASSFPTKQAPHTQQQPSSSSGAVTPSKSSPTERQTTPRQSKDGGEPQYMTKEEEQEQQENNGEENQPTSPNPEEMRTRANRMSASADELLKDLHSSTLKLQGMDENIAKRRKEYMRLFLHADRIYSSPLTRALQTAVMSMDGHRCLESSGISLYR